MATQAPSPSRPWPWIGLGLATVASALVFWLFDALPFQDLPAHAGLIALRHRFAGSPFDQQYFVFAPHLGPYSLFRFLGECFVGTLGPVGAARAIATLPVVATPLALLWGRRRLHGDETQAAGYFGLSLGFGFMTLLGFASYLLGIAVLLVAITLWLELLVAVDRREPERIRKELVLGVASPFVLVAHGHAFALYVALAGLATVAVGDRLRRVLRLRALVPALAFAAWVAWRERTWSVPAGSVPVLGAGRASWEPHFQGVYGKLSLLITPTLLTRTGVDAAVGLGVWAVLVGACVATFRSLQNPSGLAGGTTIPASRFARREHASRAHSSALLAMAVGLGVAFLFLPHSIGWFGFVDGRLVPLILYMAILAVRRPALGRALTFAFDRGAIAAACVMILVVLSASSLFQAEATGFHEVLAAVPAKTRLLNLPIDPDSAVFTAHPFVHYDKLVVAERPEVVSDVWFHQGSALYPTAKNPALRLPSSYSESDLRSVDWASYRLTDWDYVLMRTRARAAMPAVPASFQLAAHRGGWWLFQTGVAPLR